MEGGPALAQIEQSHPHLVLLDDGMDGFEVSAHPSKYQIVI